MISTRRLFSIRALAGLGIFAGVRRAWAQCSYASSIAMTFAKTTAGGVARLRFPPGKTP